MDHRPRSLFLRIIGVLLLSLPIAFLVQAVGGDWPILRIYSRVAAILALVITIRHVQSNGYGWSLVGLGSPKRLLPECGFGFALGVVSFLALLALKFVSGAVEEIPLDAGTIATKGLKSLGQAILIGLSEELFFRGYITNELCRGLSRAKGIIIASAFFSAVHFLRVLPAWQEVLAEAFGLFLIGVALSVAMLQTGRIYFSAGLHAAWVFLMKWDNSFVFHATREPDWFWAGDRIVMSVPAWGMILLMIVMLPRVLKSAGMVR